MQEGPRITRSIPTPSVEREAIFADFADAIARADADGVAALLLRTTPLCHITDVVDEFGFTPLHLAVDANCSAIVKLLVAAGADVDAKDDLNGSTPTHEAAADGHLDCLAALIDGGASLQVDDFSEASPLQCAVQRNRLDCVELILDRVPRLVDYADKYERTSCHWALSNGNFELFQRLLPICQRPTGFLHCITDTGVAELLLSHGYDVNERKNGKTPLHCAAAVGCVPMIRLLVARGALIDASCHHVTPFVEAVRNSRREAVEWLLAFGCSVETVIKINVRGDAALAATLLAEDVRVPDADCFGDIETDVAASRRRLACCRAKIVAARVATICCALQSADLPALVSVYIVDADSPIAARVPLHLKWRMITVVKHFRDR